MPRQPKTLADIGEAALIERIARRAGRRPGHDWALSIGDDAAILRPRQGQELVFTADAQVEGVHFVFGREPARTVGRRAMVVNLSDLAAMGATPVGALLSLAAPRSFALAEFDSLIAGFVAESKRYACPLVGGNLSRAGEVSLHVTVIGRCARGRSLTRRGVGPGDELFVTGELGTAALAREKADREGTRLTRVPTPRLSVGRRLARLSGVRACIDLSDGLATDLGHLLEAGDFGAEIDPDSLPRSRSFDRSCRSLGLDPVQLMVRGGEDFELLFAFRGPRNSNRARTLSDRFGSRVTRIGRITDEKGIRGIPEAGVGHHF